jgi:hypothetical protein
LNPTGNKNLGMDREALCQYRSKSTGILKCH